MDADVDVLGEGYTAETLHLPDDDEGPVVATLVARPAGEPTTRAVLHLHGYADYFFHTGYAEWWNERGYDFYALDLRKYGRSLLPHQTPNYVADLREYYPELDQAWARISRRDDHPHVVLTAHSTGGLTVPLWVDSRPEVRPAGLILNSPWFDMQGAWWMRTVGTAILNQMGVRRPRRQIPRRVTGLYGRSLHRDHEGEFDFDLLWKPVESWPVHAGWLRAIRLGHARLHRGLEVGCPALVLSSSRSAQPLEMGEEVHRADLVLDVEQIRRWAPSVGRHVTSIAVEDGRHDLVLSLPEVRERVYAEMARWLTAYVEDR
ncbi:alpha/beta hydrolase [Nocardioides donggukensis]|uniref:Alpha/beta hydrolase n=1 Tax=Nocardioides donggukensis TaxID=2774019 RepID=A0A927K428_9ACTN|nr:alpha/beta hydrolase [Nocardioides donggukensis]MBD8869436.1 alpha/beta hydrolase [Nocardioides donggukensis]